MLHLIRVSHKNPYAFTSPNPSEVLMSTILQSIETVVVASRACVMPEGKAPRYEARVRVADQLVQVYGSGTPPAKGESIVVDHVEYETEAGDLVRKWQPFGG